MFLGIDIGNIFKSKKKKKTKNRKRMGKLGNITRSSEDNLEVLIDKIYSTDKASMIYFSNKLT